MLLDHPCRLDRHRDREVDRYREMGRLRAMLLKVQRKSHTEQKCS